MRDSWLMSWPFLEVRLISGISIGLWDHHCWRWNLIQEISAFLSNSRLKSHHCWRSTAVFVPSSTDLMKFSSAELQIALQANLKIDCFCNHRHNKMRKNVQWLFCRAGGGRWRGGLSSGIPQRERFPGQGLSQIHCKKRLTNLFLQCGYISGYRLYIHVKLRVLYL